MAEQKIECAVRGSIRPGAMCGSVIVGMKYCGSKGLCEHQRIPEPQRGGMKVGGRYNWKNQPERLVYIGRNWSGNGYWNQFEKVGEPGKVWCEVLDSDLHMIEETQSAAGVEEPVGINGLTEAETNATASVFGLVGDGVLGTDGGKNNG